MVVRSIIAVAAILLVTASAHAQTVSDDDKAIFVENNLIHIFLHETGHALIDQFQLPVIGQEEDAVDAFATVEAMRMFDDAEGLLLDTADAMLIMDEQVDSYEIADYFGTHDLDIQRGLRVVCHLYGLDPDRYSAVADQYDMPQERRDTCEDDAGLADDSWAVLLEPYALDVDAEPKPINLVVDEDVLTDAHRAVLIGGGLQDLMVDYLKTSFDWPQEITLHIDECGEPNAFYDPAEISVTMCVEMIDFLFELAEQL